MDESHPLQAQSPYAATKIASDMLALSYFRSFELPVVVVRPFNTFGPRQSARAVIPTILGQLLADRPVSLGALDTRRDFTWARDTASGFCAAAESTVSGEVVNLGTGQDHSIGEVAELAARVLGRSLNLVRDERRIRPKLSEVSRLQSDPRKALRLFGWQPASDFADGLRKTADWMMKNRGHYDVGQYAV
jgi:dTDP-glucose 4,6-dehydratase